MLLLYELYYNDLIPCKLIEKDHQMISKYMYVSPGFLVTIVTVM